MSIVLAVAAGFATGIVSGWGIGGGTLLVLYMAACTDIEQKTAQGINLVYFIPVAVAALFSHIKNKMIVWKAVIPAVITAVPVSVGLSFLALNLDGSIMRRIFGGFVCALGLFEIVRTLRGPRLGVDA